MPIEFRCTQCQTLLRTPDDTAGRRAVCPKCGLQMDVPVPEPEAPVEVLHGPYAAPDDYGPQPASPSAPAQMAITSLILGIVSLCFSCCCLIGLPTAIVGIVLGNRGLESRHRGFAIAGIVLSVLGLLAALGMTIANLIVGGFDMQGQRPFP